MSALARALRQARVSVRERGWAETLYWGAFGFLRPNTFVVMQADLPEDVLEASAREDVVFAIWGRDQLAQWRECRRGLEAEYYRDQVDGVSRCLVGLAGDEVLTLIWIYGSPERSRLFELGPGTVELNHGCVRKSARGSGLFRDLLRWGLGALAAEGVRRAVAMVHSENPPSIEAFGGAGFRERVRVRHFLWRRPKLVVSAASDNSGAGGSSGC